jgi:hypothetical protein
VPDYEDRRITCTDSGLRIRGYYFPWGTKRIPWGRVRSLERFDLTILRGRGRIWGSGDLRHWANLDLHRPRKRTGFTVRCGRWVLPVVTPDDPDAFEAAARAHLSVPPA